MRRINLRFTYLLIAAMTSSHRNMLPSGDCTYSICNYSSTVHS